MPYDYMRQGYKRPAGMTASGQDRAACLRGGIWGWILRRGFRVLDGMAEQGK